MTTEQLDRRLDKIKDTSKILNFAQLAYESKNTHLLNRVKDKARRAGILLPDYQVPELREAVRARTRFTCGVCEITFPTRGTLDNHFCIEPNREERMFPGRIDDIFNHRKQEIQEIIDRIHKKPKPKPDLNANGQPRRRCKRI